MVNVSKGRFALILMINLKLKLAKNFIILDPAHTEKDATSAMISKYAWV